MNIGKNGVYDLIREEKWKDFAVFDLDDIAESVEFKDGLRLVNKILFHDWNDDALKMFAKVLLERIKEHYPSEWEKDWRNYAFLSWVYEMNFDDRKAPIPLAKALSVVESIPPGLAIKAVSWATRSSVIDFSYEEMIALLEPIVEINPYENAVLVLRSIYRRMNDKENENKYNKLLKVAIPTEESFSELNILPRCLFEPFELD